MRYIVDSNSFITPHRGYSPIDVARSLWSKISSNAGEIKLPDACAKFGVRCLMLQDMFREMGESY